MTDKAPRGLAFLLAAMTAIAPFSIDTYLPAFPEMGTSLGATPIEVQQTLAIYMAAFAFMMLWHGALADALGRKRVLLVAFAIYVAASLVCVFAASIEVLWFGRMLQGMSAGAGMVLSRAIIRDLLEGPAAQRMIAHTGMIFAIAPAIAPVIGGWIHAFFGWHAIFIFLACYGVALFAAVHFLLPETLPPERRQSLHPGPLARAYFEVFTHPPFLALALTVALSFNGFFIYVVSAPKFLLEHVGVSERGFLWLFGPAMLGLMGGNWLSAHLAGQVSSRRTIGLGFAIMIAAAIVNLALNLWLPPTLPWAVLPQAVYLFGVAVAMPVLTLRILDLFPDRRGLISSCQGATQTGMNAITAAVLAPMFWDTTLSLATSMVLFLAVGLAAFSFRRFGGNGSRGRRQAGSG
ncbi:MAG: multidrug effflux MFS transporter [Gammaproteobacteria bacterium]|nr:multidrug effflux MFS transporter [Gammaproteobacteria bacterium]MBU1415908.1 multidrug effflux MFS transporter [Gammaproteobacteria bacterium]